MSKSDPSSPEIRVQSGPPLASTNRLARESQALQLPIPVCRKQATNTQSIFCDSCVILASREERDVARRVWWRELCNMRRIPLGVRVSKETGRQHRHDTTTFRKELGVVDAAVTAGPPGSVWSWRALTFGFDTIPYGAAIKLCHGPWRCRSLGWAARFSRLAGILIARAGLRKLRPCG